MIDERTQHELHDTLDVVRPYASELRARGYDATLWAEAHDDHLTVEIRVRVPPLGVPIETTTLDG